MAKNELKPIKDAKLSRGMQVVLRLDLNVPCMNNVVQNDFRIKRILPTLEMLKEAGCKTVIISHIDADSGNTLAPIAKYLSSNFFVVFAESLDAGEKLAAQISEGGFVLVENIRRELGEMENGENFSRRLAALGDIYVNDAFAVSHREHASIVGVPKILPSYIGTLFEEEIKQLSLAFLPERPALFVLGGAKFETKLPLLLKLLNRYDRVFVGGALANDIFRTMGLEVGESLVSPIAADLKTIVNNPNLRIPLDVVVKRDGATETVSPEAVRTSDYIVDLGIKTVELLEQFASESKFILWNGPLGLYQDEFMTGTEQFAKSVARSGARSIIGGGDTIAAVEKLGLSEKFSFISTGGGAMLEFLANETLPGIEALKHVVL